MSSAGGTRARPSCFAKSSMRSSAARGQEAIAAEWSEKARALLALGKLNIADAMVWQRDAAKAGAPLSREPLASLKAQLADRIKGIEDLQHRVQVQREAAVLLAQRIEVLSTKSWRDAQAAAGSLATDVPRLASPGPGIAGRPELGQRRYEIPAFAGRFTRPASGSLGCIPERAGPGREGGRGCVGAAAAGAGMGRRAARRARCAGGSAGEAKPSPRSIPKCARKPPRSCAMCSPSWSRRLPRATARPAPAPRRRCAMRSRNTPS